MFGNYYFLIGLDESESILFLLRLLNNRLYDYFFLLTLNEPECITLGLGSLLSSEVIDEVLLLMGLLHHCLRLLLNKPE